MKKRTASYIRKSTETEISAKLNIDGAGTAKIDTGIGFLNHMLELFAFWGYFDLELTVKKSDLNVDIHHTNEDVGIVLGEIFKKALGDKKGIKRCSSAQVPMEDVVASVVIDISGRGWYKWNKPIFPVTAGKDGYQLDDVEHLFDSLAKHAGMNLHIDVSTPAVDLHTTLEPVFKALGMALDQATQIDPRRKGVPSTKGVID